MADKSRGLIRIIIQNFISSLRPNLNRTKFIGKDHFGTKYYETKVATYSERKKPSRYFEPLEEDNHEQEIPAEWESWLRHRRQDPPTEEEVLKNAEIAEMKKINAANLETMYSTDRPRQLDASVKQGRRSFPTYPEYTEKPKL